ncbi:alpha-L-fucosidase [Botryobacter ruber]|uniref:alpha-L-fucosidase n=1 Tax=Botryobacter ruber TaxID=2171629 RepID=UPI00196B7128|nr:alpha-L-fucosidase [Botryobacter ruber]
MLVSLQGLAQHKENEAALAEHSMINVNEAAAKSAHTLHPDAQWYPEAGLGLFIHWGLSSVKDLDASWPMITGWGLASIKLDSAEMARVIRERHYNINNERPVLTPNEYWAMAKEFKPTNYDPDKWLNAAKEAGFTYAVLTTKHHEGFAMWPSNYGDFSTKNYMGGKDLVKPFIEACRKHGLKVGLYFSPPDWYFERDYKSFRRPSPNNPDFPELDADLNPRTTKPDPEALKQHKAAYAALVRGQILELLTNYGKIDLLWFDGKAPIENATRVVTPEEIRKLQPGIVMNPRMHGTGDFRTFERTPPAADPGDVWAEFCNPWTNSWANSNTIPFRSNAFILGQFVSMRAWGVNYLPSVGPKADGSMPDAVYENMKVVEKWMQVNGRAVKGTGQLPAGELASVPATAQGNYRYLFAIPEFKSNGMYEKDRLPAKDTVLTLKVPVKPKSVTLLGSKKALSYKYANKEVTVTLPASMRSNLVDVVQVEL